jgi:hypothetical protein
MECLREEYKNSGLSDEQIITAKCINISPEDIERMKEAYLQLGQSFIDMWDRIVGVLRCFIEPLKPSIEEIGEDIYEKLRSIDELREKIIESENRKKLFGNIKRRQNVIRYQKPDIKEKRAHRVQRRGN